MSCNELPVEGLVAWLDGESDREETARVEAHLARCAVCRREAALLRESGALLSKMPRLQAPAGFEAGVLSAARRRSHLSFLRPLPAAAAAAALLALGAGTWWMTQRPPLGALTAGDEELLAEDLAVISNLDALQLGDADELAQIADELDVLDALPLEEDG